MGHRDKRTLAFVGAGVRVAGDGRGAQRWAKARAGTIANVPTDQGAEVLVRGENKPRFISWADMDIAEKPRPHLQDIPIAEIRPSRWQYRRSFDPEALLELAHSIARYGLINPVLVFRHEESGFELIAGERRIRATWALAWAGHDPDLDLKTAIAKVAANGWADDWLDYDLDVGKAATIRAEVRPGAGEDWRAIAVIENLQRENPSSVEEAEAFKALMEANAWNQKDLAGAMGKSPAYISQRLALLGLGDVAKQAAHEGAIPFASARAIAAVPEGIQGALTEQIKATMAGPDPATTRAVQSLASQAKAFFDPERWIAPADPIPAPDERNVYRLIQYHIRYLIEHNSERVPAALATLQDAGYNHNRLLGSKPATIVGQRFYTVLVLNALTGQDLDPYKGLTEYWLPFGKLAGYTCDQCQFTRVKGPQLQVDPASAPCARWRGETVNTCLYFLGDGDPIRIALDYGLQRAISHSARAFDVQDNSLGDLEQLRELLELADRMRAAEDSEAERQKERGYLDRMMEYWRAQCAGDSALYLVNAQSHACQLCRFFIAGYANDPGSVPCRYAADPLRGRGGCPRAPAYAILVRSDGLTVPRCERFQVAEVPAIAPVRGVSFPDDEAGRAVILQWLGGLIIHKFGFSDRQGALVGPLTWLPYERGDKVWDRDLLIAWLNDRWHWAECGGDQAIARLLSVALYEREARDQYQGSFVLMSPITGELEEWAAMDWSSWRQGDTPYNYPAGWPKPKGGGYETVGTEG